MGELFGIPEWLFVTLWVVAGLSAWIIWGMHRIRKAHKRVALKRPSPTKDDFMALMADDVHPQTAEFLWETALFYVQPRLAPHPDDELSRDLRIDDDDWSMDWPRDFARLHGFHESNLPDWPEGWPVTIRSFGRWLDTGLVAPREGSPPIGSGLPAIQR